MSTLFEVLETEEGRTFVLTKRRWMCIFPWPHTSVMPEHGGKLKDLGTFVVWSTRDPALLKTLHDAIVRFVREVGISGLFDFANSVKKSERIWNEAFPRSESWLQEMSRQAIEEAVDWPMPKEVLRYIRKFR